MPKYIIKGVDSKTQNHITATVTAESKEDARIVSDTHGIIDVQIEEEGINYARTSKEVLRPGDSIEKGYCPKCGDVAVKIEGAGYHPGLLTCLIHLVLILLTKGWWSGVWIGYALVRYLSKGTKKCLNCGELLRAS